MCKGQLCSENFPINTYYGNTGTNTYSAIEIQFHSPHTKLAHLEHQELSGGAGTEQSVQLPCSFRRFVKCIGFYSIGRVTQKNSLRFLLQC